MGYKPETLATYAAIADLAQSGKTVDEIMDLLSLTRTMVYRGLHYSHIKLERDTDHSIELVKPLIGVLPSQAEIARQTGLSTTTVWRIVNLIQNGSGPSVRQPYQPKVIHLPDLDPIWAAEFRGFFYGEGCATLDNEHSHLSPRLTINLRLDDSKILDDIHSKLDGSVFTRKRSLPDHDQYRWTATGWPLCRAILEKTGLTNACLLLSKKRQDISMLYQSILDRYQMPHLFRDEDRAKLMDYYHKLQEVKRFQL